MSHASDFPACLGQDHMARIVVDSRAFYVAPAAAPLFEGFLREIVARGYSLDEGILDDWSYACRNIRDSTFISEHARGCAVDINAVHNPQGTKLVTDMPWWVPVVGKSWGLRWGGAYTTARKDAMHYEYMGTKAEIPALVAAHKPNPRDAPESSGVAPGDPEGVIKFFEVLLNLNGQEVPVDGVFGKDDGQAVRNLKAFFNAKHIGTHVFDLSRERGWIAGPKFCETLAAWTRFLKAQGAF